MPINIKLEPTLVKCQFCKQNQPIKNIVITEIEDGTLLYTCPQCYGLIHTCRTCEYVKTCNFLTDTSEPPIINQTVRQGPMIMQTQVKNPHLIDKHCISCRCSYGDKGDCHREYETGINCSSYKFATELLND